MPIPARIHDLLKARARVAVVGASQSPSKYGHVITRFLQRHDFPVVPVNPHCQSVLGIDAVATVADALPVAIVDFVVPPSVSLEVVRALQFDGPPPVLWFQPGSFDAQVVAAAEALGGEVIAGPCIMVEARRDAD